MPAEMEESIAMVYPTHLIPPPSSIPLSGLQLGSHGKPFVGLYHSDLDRSTRRLVSVHRTRSNAEKLAAQLDAKGFAISWHFELVEDQPPVED